MLETGAFGTTLPCAGAHRLPLQEPEVDPRPTDTQGSELHHRLCNLLAVVDAITRRTLVNSAQERAVAETLSIRFAAIAAANDVFRVEAESGDIRDIVEDALSPFGLAWDGRIAVIGPSIVVGAALSLALKMVLHELATNAIKHGALSDERGRLVVTWTFSSPSCDAVSFRWVERSGFELLPQRRRGFGTTMIGRVLERHVDRPPEATFSAEGIRFAFTARLSANDERG